MLKPTKKTIVNELRDYAMITVSMLSYCIGWIIFLLPNNISTGGVAGISSILYWGTAIPAQLFYFAINIVLLGIALVVLGWRFCVKTIYAVIMLTVASSIVGSVYHEHWLCDEPFMAAIIGSVFCGCGVGLCLANNGSTGGTDIIAAIINKYRDVSLGHVIMFCDIFIISSSYLVLRDFERVIYGYVVLYVTAFCIDWVVQAMRSSVQFFIISEKWQEIGHRINREPHRGCTVINARGFYSGHDVKMLFVLAKRRQSDMIFRIINDVDPGAFVSQSAVIGVYGEGFDHFKVRRTRAPKITKEETT